MKASRAIKIALVLIIAGAVVAVLASPLRHQLTLANARAFVTNERAQRTVATLRLTVLTYGSASSSVSMAYRVRGEFWSPAATMRPRK